MYNPKDIQFVGKHDYDKDNSLAEAGWNKTFSVGIFKWELKSNGRAMKRGKILVRVSGDCDKSTEVFKKAEEIVSLLDANQWNGRKSVQIK
jgi:hypothetical protein